MSFKVQTQKTVKNDGSRVITMRQELPNAPTYMTIFDKNKNVLMLAKFNADKSKEIYDNTKNTHFFYNKSGDLIRVEDDKTSAVRDYSKNPIKAHK